ncbi:MAG: hypothetical protein LC540_19560 [Candidatus Thiodiazotropha sp.]|nr:hypothetical protein [Candidatus Thiodiazotropha sp.]
MQEAVEVIERYEAILGEAAQDRKKNNLRNIEEKPQPKNEDPTVASILKKLDARLEKLESMSLAHQIAGRDRQQWRQNPNNRNKNCFFCFSPDHMIKNCPEKAKQGPKPRYAGPSNNQPQGNRVPQNTNSQSQSMDIHNSQRQPGQFPQFNPPATVVQENGHLSTQ